MRFGLFVTIHVKPGQRDAVVDILMRDVEETRALGRDLYVVGVSEERRTWSA